MTTISCRREDTSSTDRRNQVLGSLFNERWQRLYGFVLGRVRDADDAAEIAQQAFAEALDAYDNFRGESELHTWLYSIALNLTRNHLSRSPGRRYQFDGDERLAECAAEHADPIERLEARQAVCALQRGLRQLPAEMRATLLCVTLEDSSYAEAAEAFSVPVGTVRSRVSRARSMLRACLSEEGVTAQAC
ncbi:RNA polymerase sigma factor [Aquabacterium sp. A7-Y]|uniref:RNA polymerase sigma factor n=1 Tax=Aquabacterium sp. A7-Y TaxID=1349605 RepID=UPI00223D81F3|nr:RNA polymerase sigma factor [Aquabacterium sp. A7-Y]MCW7541565.1 RNA polymerase sigma factor [Aquabacterium sp. A7-Y]